MKFKAGMLMLLALIIVSCGGSNKPQAGKTLPKTEDLYKQVAYLNGFQMGRQTEVQKIPVDIDYFMQGFLDGQNLKFDSTKAPFNFDSIPSIMNKFQMEMAKKELAKMKEDSLKALKDNADILATSSKYLEENKNKPGVKVTASGLQYKVIKEGNGPKCDDSSVVSIHFVGKLTNGKEFDNTAKRGEPLIIPISRLVPGWKEALKLMTVGSKWEVVIPSDLAYGAQGAGNVIPPNATLIFEIELNKILTKAEAEAYQKAMMQRMQQQQQQQMQGQGHP